MSFIGIVAERLLNRNKALPATLAALVGGLAFPVLTAYLFLADFPLEFVVYYTMSASLGSVSGQLASRVVERLLHLRPDQHQKQKNMVSAAWLFAGLTLWLLTVLVLEFNGWFFGLLTHLPLPSWLQSLSAVLIAAVFVGSVIVQSFTHGISSRWGNRNNDAFHARSLAPHAIVMFLYTLMQLATLSSLQSAPLFVIGMALASTLGAMLAKEYGERVERRFGLVMDAPAKK
jgi:hypothetical protein